MTSSQLGLAVESDLNLGPGRIGFDLGYASGDSAPGFGAFPQPGETAPSRASSMARRRTCPRDHTVDNFRFHPDYHIDQILFREIIGTITDAFYLRPHARITLFDVGRGHLEAGAALIASWAVEATSTPSGKSALGIELDPELRYASRDGFALTLDYGVLVTGRGVRQHHAQSTTRTVVPRAGGVRVLMRAALLFLTACGVNMTPQPDPTPALPSCIPNRDGQITAAELPIALGATASYYAGHQSQRQPLARERRVRSIEGVSRRYGRRARPRRARGAVVRRSIPDRPVRRRRRQRPRRHLPPGRSRVVARRHRLAGRNARRRQDPDPLRRSDRAAPVPANRRAEVLDDRGDLGRDDRGPAVRRQRSSRRRCHRRRAARRAVRPVLAGASRAHARHAHAFDRNAGRRQAHDALHVRMLRRGRSRREQARRNRPRTSRPPHICAGSPSARRRIEMWDAWKKGFLAWEQATTQFATQVLQNPSVIGPAGAMLSAALRTKAATDRMLEHTWSAFGLSTRRDQERTLHQLNQLQSRIYDLEEQLLAQKGS